MAIPLAAAVPPAQLSGLERSPPAIRLVAGGAVTSSGAGAGVWQLAARWRWSGAASACRAATVCR